MPLCMINEPSSVGLRCVEMLLTVHGIIIVRHAKTRDTCGMPRAVSVVLQITLDSIPQLFVQSLESAYLS